VLKNRATDEPLFVVVFTLLPKEDKGTKEGDMRESPAEKEEVNDDLD
jgi:hypothetical protein